MQGAAWLQMKTEDELHARARRVIFVVAPLAVLLFAIAGVWLYYGIDGYVITAIGDLNGPSNPLLKTAELQAGAWFLNYEKYPIMMLAPALGLLLPLLAVIATKFNRAGFAFLFTSLTQAAVLMTFALSIFPFVMPSSINPSMSFTVWDAVSSEMTLNIMTIAAVIFLPIVLFIPHGVI